MVRSHFLPAAALAFSFLSTPAVAAPVFDAVHAMGKSPVVVERIFGRPTGTVRNDLGESRDYTTSHGTLTVTFNNGKAVRFVLNLTIPVKSASQAVALLGVSIGQRKPDIDNPFHKVWRGKLGNPLVKQASAMNTNLKGYNEVSVANSD